MFVDIAKPDTECVQPSQGLLATVNVLWPCGTRAFHPLSDEAGQAPVFSLGGMAHTLGTDAAVTDRLIYSRFNINIGDLPGPNCEFDEHGFTAFNSGMR